MVKEGKLHWNATAALLPGYDIEGTRAIYPIPFDPNRSPTARAVLERRVIEIPDTEAPDTPELTRKAAAAGGFRAVTYVPLIDQNLGIGAILFNHPRAGFKFCQKKGYRRVYGHIHERLLPFWSRFGFRVMENTRTTSL